MKVDKVVLFLALLFGFSVSTQLFADEDSLSFATYYPAPYGYYNEMQVQKMAVGVVNTTSVPAENGQLLVSRSVIFKPQLSLNAIKNLPNPQIGELAYAASEDKFYYNNQGTSSSWVPQSGSAGGSAVMYLSCPWGTDVYAGANHGWDGSCNPSDCPSGWTSVATYSEPVSVSCDGRAYNCDWTSGASTTHPVVVGRSVRVCVKN